MRVEINTTPDLEQLLNLYKTVGWLNSRDDIAFLQDMLSNTSEFICIYVQDTLVAFGRMLTDYRMSAFLDDIVVHPGFRDMGLGSLIINTLISKVPEVKKVKLTTFNAEGFYKKLGFSKVSSVPLELVKNY